MFEQGNYTIFSTSKEKTVSSNIYLGEMLIIDLRALQYSSAHGDLFCAFIFYYVIKS